MATAVWREGKVFQTTTGSGHDVVTDSAPAGGRPGEGPSPIELILAALGSCTATDVVGVLTKMQQPFTGLTVTVVGERAEDHPRVFTKVDIDYVVRGRGLNPASVNRAVDLSHTRYCSVAAMLRPTASLRYRVRIEEEKEEAVLSTSR